MICPDTVHHNWKYVAFGPDGKMYVQVGANCNICEINNAIHGQIRRYNADGTGMEIVARGVRNTVGFDWHPVTGELWFTDNGRDWAGNDGPEDELNRLPRVRRARISASPIAMPTASPIRTSGIPNACAGVTLPAALTGPHSAGLGIKFYTGSMFPQSYRNVAFIARHGSWNREKRFGYDVVVAKTDGGKATHRTVHDRHARRARRTNTTAGRAMCSRWPDGSLLVSDELHGRAPIGSRIPGSSGALRHVVTSWWRPLAFALAAAALSNTSAAQDMPIAERIKLCSACHGEDGNSRDAEHRLARRAA